MCLQLLASGSEKECVSSKVDSDEVGKVPPRSPSTGNTGALLDLNKAEKSGDFATHAQCRRELIGYLPGGGCPVP